MDHGSGEAGDKTDRTGDDTTFTGHEEGLDIIIPGVRDSASLLLHMDHGSGETGDKKGQERTLQYRT